MTTDLERFRDHARTMSIADHKPECCACGQPWCCGCPRHRDGDRRHPAGAPETNPTAWLAHAATCPGNPAAPCCRITSTDRALWARLADEVDGYLNRHSDEVLPI